MLAGGCGAERGCSQPCLPQSWGTGTVPRPGSHQNRGTPQLRHHVTRPHVFQPRDPACCTEVLMAAFI